MTNFKKIFPIGEVFYINPGGIQPFIGMVVGYIIVKDSDLSKQENIHPIIIRGLNRYVSVIYKTSNGYELWSDPNIDYYHKSEWNSRYYKIEGRIVN